MKQLIKHSLDFEQAWRYVKENLDEVNMLSSALIKWINFEEGFFFTLLPQDANLERLYAFEEGIILVQNPTIEYVINNQKAVYTVIPTIRDELADLIVNEISKQKSLFCILDDTIRKPSDKKHLVLYDTHGLTYQDEIYYLFTKNNINHHLMLEGLNYSNAFWHSLGILTEAFFSEKAKTLTLDRFQEVASKTKLIMVGAYDGEGYVFWEKNLTNENKYFFEHPSKNSNIHKTNE